VRRRCEIRAYGRRVSACTFPKSGLSSTATDLLAVGAHPARRAQACPPAAVFLSAWRSRQVQNQSARATRKNLHSENAALSLFLAPSSFLFPSSPHVTPFSSPFQRAVPSVRGFALVCIAFVEGSIPKSDLLRRDPQSQRSAVPVVGHLPFFSPFLLLPHSRAASAFPATRHSQE
jgi:hypothetical protein